MAWKIVKSFILQPGSKLTSDISLPPTPPKYNVDGTKAHNKEEKKIKMLDMFTLNIVYGGRGAGKEQPSEVKY